MNGRSTRKNRKTEKLENFHRIAKIQKIELDLQQARKAVVPGRREHGGESIWCLMFGHLYLVSVGVSNLSCSWGYTVWVFLQLHSVETWKMFPLLAKGATFSTEAAAAMGEKISKARSRSLQFAGSGYSWEFGLLVSDLRETSWNACV